MPKRPAKVPNSGLECPVLFHIINDLRGSPDLPGNRAPLPIGAPSQ
ncbi:MAG: hypothetical protein WBN23_15085 [Woeseia sp.]